MRAAGLAELPKADETADPATVDVALLLPLSRTPGAWIALLMLWPTDLIMGLFLTRPAPSIYGSLQKSLNAWISEYRDF
jgi:hypothetical protein